MEEKNGKLSIIVAPENDGGSGGKRSFWHINKKMLPYKMHFFLFIGGMGTILPFQSVLGITRLGLTASNLAAAYTVQNCICILAKPSIGYVADYFNRLKATIVGLTVLQAIFWFCMIAIPSVNLQQNFESQHNISLEEHYKCQLCDYSEKLKNMSLNLNLDEDIFRQILDCFSYSEIYGNKHFVVHCLKEDPNSLHSVNTSYQIMQKTCNNTLISDIASPTNYSTPSSLHSVDVLLIAQSFNNSHIICLSPKKNMLFQGKGNSSNLMTPYCNAVSVSGSKELQELFLASPFKTTNCQNYKSEISPPVEDEHIIALVSAANFRTYQFWTFALFLILSCTCISSIFTISDTACHESVHTQGGGDYGQQRAWGAISWGLLAPFAGFLNDYTDGYLASSCVMCLFCSLQIWNLSRMNLVKPDFSQSILKDIKTVFSSVEFIAFEIGVLLNGMATGVVWFYLTWFLTTIGGNKLNIGLAHFSECIVGEVPFMFISGWMIRKLGHFNLVSLAHICHGIRFFLYSYLHNPWWILPIESLHGFTFATFYSAMTSYGKLNSSPGTEATTQSVLCATYEGLGAGVGCVIAGICFDHYGGHTTFYYASFLCAIAGLINIMFTILLNCRKGGLNITETATTCKERY